MAKRIPGQNEIEYKKPRYKVFHLQFHMENQIFVDSSREEVIRILKSTAQKIESGLNSGKILDIDGNVIGNWGTKGVNI